LIVLSVIVYVLRQNCRAAGWRWDTKGKIKRNEWCTPFEKEHIDDDVKLRFLKKFVLWIDQWNSLKDFNGKLSNDTYHALRQSTLVLISLIE
jgi:hypothetical protein